MREGIPYLPGVVTPTEVIKALSLGYDHLKFFPAGDFGGLKPSKRSPPPSPQVHFMPTGGVGPDNLNEYLSFPKIFACGGSWMVKGTPEEIEKEASAAVALTRAANK